MLDLFAGTGALGLEALSRGERHVTFVDSGRKALALIRENVALLGCGDEVEVIARDALKLGPGAGCDLVFLDPPYGRDLGARALAAAARAGRIAPGALIVWEEAQAMAAPDGFEALDQRRYGDTHMTLLRWRGEGE